LRKSLAAVAIVVFALGIGLFANSVAAAAPVRASATIDRNAVTIGDQILLSVTVEADGGYGIVDSGVGRAIGGFEVIDSLAPQLSKIQNGGSRYLFQYRIAAFRVGTYILPPVQVAYQGPAGERGVAPTAELPIVVSTVIRPADSTEDVRPLKPQLRLPGAPPDISGLVRAGLVGVIALMLALIVWQTRRAMAKRAAARPAEPQMQLTPAQRAMAELTRVTELRLPEKGRYAEHYALLADALRTYVRDRFGLAATERTPRELREDMLAAGIDRTEIATIYDILREGEVVRFDTAPGYPARAQHAVRSAMDAMRRAAVAEQYELMHGQAS
jgi:hypothetical protein